MYGDRLNGKVKASFVKSSNPRIYADGRIQILRVGAFLLVAHKQISLYQNDVIGFNANLI